MLRRVWLVRTAEAGWQLRGARQWKSWLLVIVRSLLVSGVRDLRSSICTGGRWIAVSSGVSSRASRMSFGSLPDAPGAGRSSGPPENSDLADWARWLSEFIEALGVAPAHVAGLSFGGGLALELFQQHSRVVKSLILMSAYAGWGGSLSREQVEARLELTRRSTELPPEQWTPALIETLLPDGSDAELARELTTMPNDFHPAATRNSLSAFARADLRGALAKVDVPTLLIYGELDVRAPREVWAPIHDGISHSRLVLIPDVGHMVDMQAPGICNAEIRAFVREVEESSRMA